MAIFLICGAIIVSAPLAFFAFRKGADDADWELHWRSLSDLERASVAVSGLSKDSRKLLFERGEADLADGFARRELRHRSYVALATLPLVLLAAILMLAGLLDEIFAGPITFIALLLLVVYTRRRESQIRTRYRTLQGQSPAVPET